jgi:peptidoglycan/LPS O-acetylase OafA/YrhL
MVQNIYFKGLNGIRAIAAVIVLIWHLDQFSYLLNIKNIGISDNGMAGQAVNMFFVLSGFLITYLLLTEGKLNKRINIKKFYIRRILRIWPLYYLALIISLLLIYLGIINEPPQLENSIVFYSFLLANIPYVLSISINTITPLWSVAVEEQFYIIWPHLFKSTKNILPKLVIFFLFYFFLKISIYLLSGSTSVLFKLITLVRFDIMCIGGFGAYLIFIGEKKYLKIIHSKILQFLSWGILLFSIIFKPLHLFSIIDNEINSIFYLVIILNVSCNKKTIISLENVSFNFLGKISYGLYVYHMIIIFLLAYFVKKNNYQLNLVSYYSIVIVGTISVSYLSHRYFEMFFLRKKHKYSLIRSGNKLNV